MLKVILVDDEKVTCEGLKRFIPWEELSVGSVETFCNELQVPKFAEGFKPDILITDIKMPNMSGVELAKKVLESCPSCKVIFLTAFAEKEYLKKAIELQVSAFVEKPVIREEIIGILRTVSAKLLAEKKDELDKKNIRRQMEENSELILQKVARDLTLKTGVQRVIERKNELDCDLFQAKCFISCMIKISSFDIEEDKKRLTENDEFLHEICRCMQGYGCMGFVKDEKHIVAHFYTADPKAIGDERSVFENLLKELNKNSENKYQMFLSVGKKVYDIADIPQSYEAAVITLQTLFFLGYGKVSVCTEDTKPDVGMQSAYYLKFQDALNDFDADGAQLMLENLVADLKKSQNILVPMAKKTLLNIEKTVFDFAEKNGLTSITDSNEEENRRNSILNSETLDEIKLYLVKIIDALFEELDINNVLGSSVIKAIKFIDENYADSNLSIKQISDKLYFAPTYFCNIFKKKMNKTINHYITEIRIEKAKQLLLDRQNKLHSISNMVGYTSSSHFTKLFKKLTGLTPSEYREKHS